MLDDKKLNLALQPDERVWLDQVVGDLQNDELKLVYADWLEEREDNRANFLRQFVALSKSFDPADIPKTSKIPEAWLDLIGFRILERLVLDSAPGLREPLNQLARPALRMKQKSASERSLEVGASKIGGHPDLPKDFAWPKGKDCKAIYNLDTDDVEELAGFMAQVNLAEIAHTPAAELLPDNGLLSFFCFMDLENDNPDAVSVKALYFEDPNLVRTKPPGKLTEGNGVIRSQRLIFEETLDLPCTSSPWRDEMFPPKGKSDYEIYDFVRGRNFDNMLGYGRATTGDDPTPSKDSRHLILLENEPGCRMHIQILEADLIAKNFDAITLSWVDFD
jgi:uncharacterized protein (TIGR02996 family)